VGEGFILLAEVSGYIEYPVTHESRTETRGVHDAHFRDLMNTYCATRGIFRRSNASRRSGGQSQSLVPEARRGSQRDESTPAAAFLPSPGQPD